MKTLVFALAIVILLGITGCCVFGGGRDGGGRGGDGGGYHHSHESHR